MPNLVIREWNESPVCGPRILEDVLNCFEILIEPRSPKQPDSCVAGGFVQNGLHEFGGTEVGGETIGKQVLYTLVSLACQPSSIVRAGVAHHNHWRRVVTVHKKAALLIDGKVERATDSHHALVTQPEFSRTQQFVKRFRLILGLEEAEKSGGIPV